MDLVGLLILVIVIGLLVWLVKDVLPLPPPWKTVAIVLVVLIAIIWLLNIGGIEGPWMWRRHVGR